MKKLFIVLLLFLLCACTSGNDNDVESLNLGLNLLINADTVKIADGDNYLYFGDKYYYDSETEIYLKKYSVALNMKYVKDASGLYVKYKTFIDNDDFPDVGNLLYEMSYGILNDDTCSIIEGIYECVGVTDINKTIKFTMSGEYISEINVYEDDSLVESYFISDYDLDTYPLPDCELVNIDEWFLDNYMIYPNLDDYNFTLISLEGWILTFSDDLGNGVYDIENDTLNYTSGNIEIEMRLLDNLGASITLLDTSEEFTYNNINSFKTDLSNYLNVDVVDFFIYYQENVIDQLIVNYYS